MGKWNDRVRCRRKHNVPRNNDRLSSSMTLGLVWFGGLGLMWGRRSSKYKNAVRFIYYSNFINEFQICKISLIERQVNHWNSCLHFFEMAQKIDACRTKNSNFDGGMVEFSSNFKNVILSSLFLVHSAQEQWDDDDGYHEVREQKDYTTRKSCD